MKALLLATVSIALLAGCVPSDEATSPSPTPVASESTTPTATPAPSREPEVALTSKPAVADLVLSPDGLGPIVIGMPMPSSAVDVGMVTWTDSFCGSVFDYEGTSYASWLTNYDPGAEYTWAFLAEPSLDSAAPSAPIDLIVVMAPEIRTAGGLGVGSSVDELKAEYGSALKHYSSYDAEGWVVEGDYGQLVFWDFANDAEGVLIIDVTSHIGAPEFSYTVTHCA